ncbi:hypothetical protein EIP91_008422 [Steccherinum ochraceum]|uniref:F-box domain-containing protein n=1 Tax=Steccherinum ochraceum TaxID=92696 RepID=A0A4R0R5K8_9APHY|nr:hypothetical protein EIP91_008422 [Steccherinum ochraceum]
MYDSRWTRTWTLTRSLQLEDVSTLLFYSSRIREMYFPSQVRPVSLGQLPRDVPLLAGTMLFRQLRALVCIFCKDTTWNVDFVLDKADGLTEMTATIKDPIDEPTKFMAVMQQRSHHLSLVSFEDRRTEEDTRRASIRLFGDLLQGAGSLRELHFHAGLQQYLHIWDVIPAMPLLSRLAFDSDSTVQGPGSPTSYHTLTVVKMNVLHPRDLSSVLDKVVFPNLCELNLRFYEEVDVISVRHLLSSILSVCPNPSFKSLRIYSTYLFSPFYIFRSRNPDSAEHVLDLSDLRPLMDSYPKLEVLDLRLQCPWVLGNDDLEAIARVWGPELTILRLDPEGGWSRSPTKCITVEGLEQLASRCPHLTTLGVHFVKTPSLHTPYVVPMYLDRELMQSSEEPHRLLYAGSLRKVPPTVKKMRTHLQRLFSGLGKVCSDKTQDEKRRRRLR